MKVNPALNYLKSSTIQYRSLTRELDAYAVVTQSKNADIELTAHVLPTTPAELKATPEASVFQYVYSFYLKGSVAFNANDKILYNGEEYEIIKGWDREANGGYTKIIAGRDKRETYTDV